MRLLNRIRVEWLIVGLICVVTVGVLRWKALSPSGTDEDALRSSRAAPQRSGDPVAREDRSRQESEAIRVLTAILESHDDNDPRLDTELGHLSREDKERAREIYLATRLEKRNTRGTVVYVLARNLTEEADIDFLRQVIAEKPCLGLNSCAGNESAQIREGYHQEGADEITLAYPQLVALKYAEDYLTGARPLPETGTATLRVGLRALVEDARHSAVEVVRYRAERFAHDLDRLGEKD